MLIATPTYEGSVATRARITTDYNSARPDTTNKYYMSRSGHVATENLTSIRVALSNFYLVGSGGQEAGSGASTAVTASVEYPSGTFTQLLFGGSANGTIPNADLLFSDYITVNIPKGANFWINEFGHNTAGCLYQDWQNSYFGEKLELSSTAITDRTMSGAINNTQTASKPPCAILGITKNPSVIILGDSIANALTTEGDFDDSATQTGHDGRIGIIAHGFPINFPFLNLAAGSQAAVGWLANSFARNKLIQKGSHVINNMAVNDLNGSESAATIIAALQLMFAQCAVWQKLFQTTTTPLSSSGTNAFTTLTEQTPRSSQSARATLIAAIRANGISPNVGFFDVASILENNNDDLWIVSPSPPYTGEGIHPTTAGYALVAASGMYANLSWP